MLHTPYHVLCSRGTVNEEDSATRLLLAQCRTAERDEAFKRGLRELGWIDGQTIVIEYRWAAGKLDQLPLMAGELVRLNVDVIFATTARVIRAAQEATTKIPIVMPAASDPVGDGFIASLARPGRNITGMSAMILELEGKRLELLREIVPNIVRVGFLNYGTDLTGQRSTKEAQDAGRRMGIQIQPLSIGDVKDLEGAFAAMVKERAGALAIQPLLITNIGQGRRIAELAVKTGCRQSRIRKNSSMPVACSRTDPIGWHCGVAPQCSWIKF